MLGICSDTHGEHMPQWPGRKLNAVLHAGDIYDGGVIQYGESYVHPRPWAAGFGVRVLAVRGNHDYRDRDGFFQVAGLKLRDRCMSSIHQWLVLKRPVTT